MYLTYDTLFHDYVLLSCRVSSYTDFFSGPKNSVSRGLAVPEIWRQEVLKLLKANDCQ